MTEAIRTPDFDHYATTESIVSAELSGPTTITVTWTDGRIDRHHPWTLRENSTDSTTTASVTRERLTDIATWGDDVIATDLRITTGGIRVRWDSDGLTADYDAGWLRNLGGRDWHPEAIVPQPITWTAEAGTPPTFDGPAYLESGEVLFEALTAVASHGLIRLQHLADGTDTVLDVGRRMGVIRPTPFGPHFDVVARPDADSQAYTGSRLAPHSDIPTRETPAGLQLLHCRRNAAAGGDSIMVDGFAVAEHLRRHDPTVFTALTTLRWVWANRSTETDVRWSAPVIGVVGERINEVRLTNTLRLFPDMDHEQVESAYRAVQTFTRLCDDPAFKVSFSLQPGDCVIFDNRRVLHGREAFDHRSGDRHLRGCYVDRDDLHSRLRMLARAERGAASP